MNQGVTPVILRLPCDSSPLLGGCWGCLGPALGSGSPELWRVRQGQAQVADRGEIHWSVVTAHGEFRKYPDAEDEYRINDLLINS